MRTEISIDIDRPINEVFEYTNDKVAEWSLTVVEDEVIEHKPGEVGTTFRVVTEEKGRRMDFQGEVTRHEPPNASAVFLKGQYFDLDVVYLFESLPSGTRVTQQSEVFGKGFTKVMFFLFGWMMNKAGCKAQESELRNLKLKLESS